MQKKELRVRALMWFAEADHQNKKIDFPEKFTMGEINVHVSDPNDVAEVKFETVKAVSGSLLQDFLKKNDIRRFFPMAQPTFTKEEDLIEVCYYQDYKLYQMVYADYAKGWVNEPTDPELVKHLERLYAFYALRPDSEQVFGEH